MKAHQPTTPPTLPPLFNNATTLRLGAPGTRRIASIAFLALVCLQGRAQPKVMIPVGQTPSTSQSVPPGQVKDAPANAPANPPSSPSSVAPNVPLPVSAPNTGSASGVDNARYVIGADDNLQITVWREPSLSGVLPVRPDGMISLVLIGDLRAAGRTPTQLSGDIAQQLKKFIQDPSVTVAVTAVNSQRIFMVGEVGHVGPVAMSPGMTPLQAISSAGGPSPYANLKRIYILRGLGARQQKIPFNYKQALKGDNRQDVILQPGDTIVVP